MSFLSTKGAEGASFLWGAEQALACGASAGPAPAGLGVGSFPLQRRDESSKQEMVTRRREQPNDLQLSSQKEKKKKVSNNRQIVAGLPEGEVSEVGAGGWAPTG